MKTARGRLLACPRPANATTFPVGPTGPAAGGRDQGGTGQRSCPVVCPGSTGHTPTAGANGNARLTPKVKQSPLGQVEDLPAPFTTGDWQVNPPSVEPPALLALYDGNRDGP